MKDNGKYFVAIDSTEGPFNSVEEAEMYANQLLSTKAKGRKAQVLRQDRLLEDKRK